VKSALRKYLLRLLLVLGIVGGGSALYAMTVQPVVIDLTSSGAGMSRVVTVENTFANPLPVEMRIQELALTEAGVQGTGRRATICSSSRSRR
jgi:hypothetical protein